MSNLIWSDGFAVSLSICIGAAIIVFTILKLAFQRQTDFAARRRNVERRRIKTNPNVICGFPIFQKAREEAPFF